MTTTNWAFKNLDALHHALDEELKFHNQLDRKTVELVSIKNSIILDIGMVDAGHLLAFCRSKMCEVCREHLLYTCDVPEGWSPNCAFLKRHES
jgi:hypothetical protein